MNDYDPYGPYGPYNYETPNRNGLSGISIFIILLILVIVAIVVVIILKPWETNQNKLPVPLDPVPVPVTPVFSTIPLDGYYAGPQSGYPSDNYQCPTAVSRDTSQANCVFPNQQLAKEYCDNDPNCVGFSSFQSGQSKITGSKIWSTLSNSTAFLKTNYKSADTIHTNYGAPMTINGLYSRGLTVNQIISTNGWIESINGKYTLSLQSDGNLVIYNNVTGAPIWSTETQNKFKFPFELKVQQDSNLVLRDAESNIMWSSGTGTAQQFPVYLVVEDSGNVVLYSNSVAVWQSNTAGK